MKKLLACASAYALILAGSIAVVPTVASADPVGKDIAAFCKEVSDAYPSVTVGDCVSIAHTKGAVQTCKIYKELGILDFLGVNMGACVSYLNKL